MPTRHAAVARRCSTPTWHADVARRRGTRMRTVGERGFQRVDVRSACSTPREGTQSDLLGGCGGCILLLDGIVRHVICTSWLQCWRALTQHLAFSTYTSGDGTTGP